MDANVLSQIQPSDKISVIWTTQDESIANANIQSLVDALNSVISTGGGSIQLENLDVFMSTPSSSVGTLILTGWPEPYPTGKHDFNLFSHFVEKMSVGGKLISREIVGDDFAKSVERIRKAAVLAGLVNIKFIESQSGTLCVTANTPSAYKTGAEDKLSWASSAAHVVSDDVWSAVEADEVVGGKQINTEGLLTASDLEKPATAPCGEPANSNGEGAPRKKRACKNCTCGLAKLEAEEAVADAAAATAGAKSACGNCYLGDAFRCSSCPYRGLPPFQPGQQVVIPEDMLSADP